MEENIQHMLLQGLQLRGKVTKIKQYYDLASSSKKSIKNSLEPMA
jgi:hypothetical protein